MQQPLKGVRVLEVAQFTFVPSAGAVLADWGAEVIKVEHAEKGDAQRGLISVLGLDGVTDAIRFPPSVEAPNRGKRSIGLALESPEAVDILHDLIRQSDVFLTNFLPGARAKLGVDVDDVRKINPDIVYVRGSGFGSLGPEADKGAYDATAFWARGGSASGTTPAGADRLTGSPSGAYGDNLGGMTLAGGIAAALYARATTGETSVVDVSLLGVGAWANQFTVNLALLAGGPPSRPTPPRHGTARNPLVGSYRTSDDRWIMLSMLQPGRYWANFCAVIGHPELVEDGRFATVENLMANAPAAGELVAQILREKTYAEWISVLEQMDGQWAAVQDSWDVANDVSLRANGMIASIEDVDGIARELVASPVLFDESPVQLRRGPQFAEHTDEILRELGCSEERLIDLKITGAVT